jgi:hypothetical protein
MLGANFLYAFKEREFNVLVMDLPGHAPVTDL